MSKRVVVGKEPSSLEKDKQGQSIYYLSYSKPAVLDMKWKNRDINVVERANIPKFSKLGDIVTPLRLLELLFDDILVDMIGGYIKLYSHREKADTFYEKSRMKRFTYS